MSAFDDFLADVDAPRCWLLEIDAFPLAALGDGTDPSGAYADAAFSELAYGEGDISDAATLYYSSHGYTSQAADFPAAVWFDGRLMGDVVVERRIHGREWIGGLAAVFAEARLVNADGGLDELQKDFALDGRPARLLLGRPTDARSAFGLVFSGIAQRVTVALDRMTINLSDGLARLNAPVAPQVYAGTGGLEGGADLAGKAKPKCWGEVFNVSPPLVDATNLIYQVHDGLINDVPAVYDRGIALIKVGGAPAAGQYQVDAAAGTFKLGATPAGTVTADVLGDAGAGYVNKTADIVTRALLIAGIDASLIDAASFTALNTAAPAEVGIWIGTDPSTVGEVVEELLAGVGAFGGFSRVGLFTVGVVAAASGASAATYDEEEILALTRDPLPAEVDPVVWRARAAWQRNYTVQTDLAAAVTTARRAFAAQAERVVTKEDPGVLSRRLLAREYGPAGNLYAQQADADTEAQRLLTLWSAARGFYRVTLPPVALARDLGEVITLTHSRHGFSAGAQARVLGHTLRGTQVELTVLA